MSFSQIQEMAAVTRDEMDAWLKRMLLMKEVRQDA